MDDVTKGARLVQLGENTHGIREYSQIKIGMIRRLHENNGFNVIVFESAVYQCDNSDRRSGEINSTTTMRLCVYGVWHTPEMVELFDYIAASQETDNPIRIVGYDIQPIGPNKKNRPDFLASAFEGDLAYSQEIRLLDQKFLVIYASGNRQSQTHFRSPEGLEMAAAYDLATDKLKNRTDRNGIIARLTLRSMADYIRQQAAPDNKEYAERRDIGMGKNLIEIAENLYPHEKLIIWAHNAHIRHANEHIEPKKDVWPGVKARLAGSALRDYFGLDVYTIGFYTDSGQAADNNGDVYNITEADPESLEGRLSALPGDAAFIDLKRAQLIPALSWALHPVSARFNATAPQVMTLSEQYDGVVVIDTATPRGSLASQTGRDIARQTQHPSTQCSFSQR